MSGKAAGMGAGAAGGAGLAGGLAMAPATGGLSLAQAAPLIAAGLGAGTAIGGATGESFDPKTGPPPPTMPKPVTPLNFGENKNLAQEELQRLRPGRGNVLNHPYVG